MTKKYYFLSLLCFISCKGNSNVELRPIGDAHQEKSLQIHDSVKDVQMQDSSIVIQIPNTEEDINLTRFHADISYIPLETKDDCLLGHIDKMYADSCYIFILDKQNFTLCSFNKNGKFQCRYGEIGHGPGEYVGISDFSINNRDKTVYLLDLAGGKVVCYTYSGEYLSEQPLYYYYNRFECLNNYWVLSSSFAHNTMSSQLDLHRLIIAEKSQKLRSRAFPFTENLRANFHYENKFVFQKTGDGHVYYNYIPSNVIYEISDSCCVARYKLKSEDGKQNWDYLVDLLSSDIAFDNYTKKHRYFSSIYLMNQEFLVCYFFTPDKRMSTLLFDRQTNHYKYGKLLHGNENTLTNKLLASHFDFALLGNTFVNVIQPFEMFKLIDEHKRFQFPLDINGEERNLLSKVTEESNPILMMISIKSF